MVQLTGAPTLSLVAQCCFRLNDDNDTYIKRYWRRGLTQMLSVHYNFVAVNKRLNSQESSAQPFSRVRTVTAAVIGQPYEGILFSI